MTLQEKLTSEMKMAMKAGDSVRLSVIRLLRAAIKNREIEKGKGKPLEEADLIEVVVSAVKQRKEAIDQYEKAGRGDLADKERGELSVLQSFLPAALSPQELEEKIQEVVRQTGASSPKDMGKVMKTLMPQVLGRADSAEVSKRVKELLTAPR